MPRTTSPLITRRAGLAGAVAMAATRSAHAESYPLRPVTLVVPYAAGGTADILARLIGETLRAKLSQTFIVENKGGAAGMLGCNIVAKADADGAMLVFTAGGPLTIGPNLNAAPPYKTATDFTPVALVGQVPSFLVVNPNNPAKTVADLIAAGRAKPNGLTFASPGVGTSVHLVAELFQLQAGFEATHVPYRGGGPAVNDLLAGHVDFLFENVPQLLPHVMSKGLRALAVTSDARVAAAPDVPTLTEAGIADVGTGTWYGLLGPRGLPDAVTTTLTSALKDILADAAFAKRLSDMGVEIDLRTGAAFAAFIRDDDARWRSTIARAKIATP